MSPLSVLIMSDGDSPLMNSASALCTTTLALHFSTNSVAPAISCRQIQIACRGSLLLNCMSIPCLPSHAFCHASIIARHGKKFCCDVVVWMAMRYARLRLCWMRLAKSLKPFSKGQWTRHYRLANALHPNRTNRSEELMELTTTLYPRRVLGTGDWIPGCFPAAANALSVASRRSSTLASRSPRRDRRPPIVGRRMFRFGQVLWMGWALRTLPG